MESFYLYVSGLFLTILISYIVYYIMHIIHYVDKNVQRYQDIMTEVKAERCAIEARFK